MCLASLSVSVVWRICKCETPPRACPALAQREVIALGQSSW